MVKIAKNWNNAYNPFNMVKNIFKRTNTPLDKDENSFWRWKRQKLINLTLKTKNNLPMPLLINKILLAY